MRSTVRSAKLFGRLRLLAVNWRNFRGGGDSARANHRKWQRAEFERNKLGVHKRSGTTPSSARANCWTLDSSRCFMPQLRSRDRMSTLSDRPNPFSRMLPQNGSFTARERRCLLETLNWEMRFRSLTLKDLPKKNKKKKAKHIKHTIFFLFLIIFSTQS